MGIVLEIWKMRKIFFVSFFLGMILMFLLLFFPCNSSDYGSYITAVATVCLVIATCWNTYLIWKGGYMAQKPDLDTVLYINEKGFLSISSENQGSGPARRVVFRITLNKGRVRQEINAIHKECPYRHLVVFPIGFEDRPVPLNDLEEKGVKSVLLEEVYWDSYGYRYGNPRKWTVNEIKAVRVTP